jgi:DNA-binding NarL/FixJ family response regulator
MACCALGDDEGAELELDAARAAFAQLGAKPDLAHLDALRSKKTRRNHQLTARELQVLRLVASGKTNKSIAVALGLSEKTVDRHLSNILTKLDVPSRAAATAYAYEHRLLGEKYPGDRPQTMGS